MILVTGGAGYIGSHTYAKLAEEGYEAVIVDNFSNSRPATLERLEQITGRKVPFLCGDICDQSFLRQVFTRHRIDAVIHFAGLKAVGESVEKPLSYYDNNVKGTLSLLKVMGEQNVKHIIFSSSATVYGVDNEMPLKETAHLGCTNPYGWTKFMIEQILRDLCVADADWSAVILRYFNPIGAHPSGLIGEDPEGIPNNLMPYISRVAVGKLARLGVFGGDYPTHDGTGVRDYIHVMDLAAGHVCALRYLWAHKGAEAFNLGTGNGYSVLDVVKAFEKATGKAVPYDIVGRRPGDVAVCYADPAKARRLLGWQTEHDLYDMCRDAWRFESAVRT